MVDNKQLIERLNDFIGWFEEEVGGMEANHPVREATGTIERLEVERDTATLEHQKLAVRIVQIEAERERDAAVLEAAKELLDLQGRALPAESGAAMEALAWRKLRQAFRGRS